MDNNEGQDPDNTPTVDELKAEIDSLRSESAKYRTQRNDALKKSHALNQVVKAHNIPFDLEGADLSNLGIDNGSVTGQYDYEAPQPKAATPVNGATPTTITRKDLETMTPEQINDNWEEISKLMQNNQL